MNYFVSVLIGLSVYPNVIFQQDKPFIEPLSDNMVNFVNKNNTTWKVSQYCRYFFEINIFNCKFRKAEQNKFHSWSLTSVKRLLGVPIEKIGRPSKLEKHVHTNVFDIPGI